MKINVVGSSGSGKSTLSQQLSHVLGIPHIQLDPLFWRADWQGTPDDEFYGEPTLSAYSVCETDLPQRSTDVN
ncbi:MULTISPECIES: hypothetical protein [Halomonas]|uniref:hypothetical protein n=1 Tax=Halomonas TaxID=2745 RepID=UPI001D02BDC1|nr:MULTISPECIES: hypothetical protein [Halomonas]